MRKSLITLIFVLILFSSLVYSTEETISSYSKQGAEYMDTGIIVNTLVYDYLPMNKNFTIYMTPYEISGKTLDNASVDCRFGLVNPDGSRLLLLSDTNGDFIHISQSDIWVATINGSFLNETGTYLYNWDCQTGTRGGYFNGNVHVVESIEPNIPLSIINSVLLTIFIILFIASLTLAYSVDGNNKFSIGDSGEPLVELNSGKYLKLFLYLLSYLFFWILTWIGWNISLTFMLSEFVTNMLRLIFIIETIFWFPLILIIVAIGLVKHIADVNIEKTTKRGLFIRKK